MRSIWILFTVLVLCHIEWIFQLQESCCHTAIARLESRVVHAGTDERMKLRKRVDILRAQTGELRVYEDKIHYVAV